jgi:hypothetical protein
MLLTPLIKPRPTLRTPTPTIQVLLHTQDILTSTTQHRFLIPLLFFPNTRLMTFQRIMAANARVKLVTTCVFDGDDVAVGVPVCALR